MEYKHARRHMQKLLRQVTSHYDKHISPKLKEYEKDIAEIGHFAAPPEIEETIKLEHHNLETKVNQFAEELAADPEFFDVLSVWTVKIQGVGGIDGENPKTDYDEMIEVLNKAGTLAHSVRAAIENDEYEITSVNVTKDIWEITIICNEPESRRLCAFIHRKFRKSMKGGLLKIRKTFDNFRLPDVCECGDEHEDENEL